MFVRMKVKCTHRGETLGSHWNHETKVHEPAHLFSYQFAFVSGDDSPENAAFWSATPSGRFEVQTIRQDAFKLGGYYYLDATLCPEEEQEGRAYS